MKAVVYRKGAHTENLSYTEVAAPVPKVGEVLVKVCAASPNAADYRTLQMGLISSHKILGSAIAGEVVSSGSGQQPFKPGDRVIGDLSGCGFGGFAEYASVPTDALALLPATLSYETAATLPVAATTALRALQARAPIRPGQSVLIVGSAGGVGTFAIQLCKYFGAVVTAVCSTANVAQSLQLGADVVIDYTSADFTQSEDRYDLILAINGHYPLLAYRRILKSHGTYVMVGGSLSQIFKSLAFGWIWSLGAKKMTFVAAKADPEDLAFTARLVSEGHIQPVIERTYPLHQTAEAMAYLSAGHARGKVVIHIA